MNKQKAIIVQLEGVLSDDSHRRHLIQPLLNSEYKEKINSGWMSISEGFFHKKTGEKFQPEYESYWAAADKDGVNEWCSVILHMLTRPFYERAKILFFTDSPKKYEDRTIEWVEKEMPFLNSDQWELFMRPDFHPYLILTSNPPKSAPDRRPYAEIKREIFENKIKDCYEVLFVLDREEEPWKELGLTLLQVK